MYLIQFSKGLNTQEFTVSVVRQNVEKNLNEVPEELNTLKNIVVESELLRQSNLEKIEFAKFNFQKSNKTELSLIDLKPEAGMVIDESKLVKEMKCIIDSLYSQDASIIKWLYPLEQSKINNANSYAVNITLKFYNYDIKVPIIVFHDTDNSYCSRTGRNKKIFHKTISLSLNKIKVTDTNWDVKFGTIINYLLIERYEPNTP